MKWSLRALQILFCLCTTHPAVVNGEQLKALTINVWSGLDYTGTIRVGEYESAEARIGGLQPSDHFGVLAEVGRKLRRN